MNTTRFAKALTILLVVGSFLACDEAVVGNDLDAASLSNNQGIACGEAICNEDTEMCCVSFHDDTYTSACLGQEETCQSTGLKIPFPLFCDGPEDCGGNPCCMGDASGIKCDLENSCSIDSHYCHTTEDCPNGFTCLPIVQADSLVVRACLDI